MCTYERPRTSVPHDQASAPLTTLGLSKSLKPTSWYRCSWSFSDLCYEQQSPNGIQATRLWAWIDLVLMIGEGEPGPPPMQVKQLLLNGGAALVSFMNIWVRR
jgi:hypothetical protein